MIILKRLCLINIVIPFYAHKDAHPPKMDFAEDKSITSLPPRYTHSLLVICVIIMGEESLELLIVTVNQKVPIYRRIDQSWRDNSKKKKEWRLEGKKRM